MIRPVAVIWTIAACLCAQAAHAGCDAANQYVFTYASRPTATLSYGTSYTYSATNGAGASQSFSVQVSQNGLSSTQVNSIAMPAISTLVTGSATSDRTLVFGGTFSGRTGSMTGTTRLITMTVTFAQPVRDFSLKAYDVDFTSNQFRDWVQVTGSDGTTSYTPVLLTPWNTGNQTGEARTSTSSSLVVGPATSPVSVSASQAAGRQSSDNNSETGTLTASFAQPVTSITFKYGNYPYTSGENSTGQQAIGIAGFTFCPMPSLSLAKTSEPVAGSLGAFNLPGNDVVYTLTLTNSGGSPVDPGTIVLTDALPSGVASRNIAFDGSTSLPVKVIDAGGMTVSAGAISYRRSGETAFTYSPTSGYDPLVDAIRITPGGALDANASLSVQFRARVE